MPSASAELDVRRRSTIRIRLAITSSPHQVDHLVSYVRKNNNLRFLGGGWKTEPPWLPRRESTRMRPLSMGRRLNSYRPEGWPVVTDASRTTAHRQQRRQLCW